MDMAPRWSGGYGFQVRHERILLDKLERVGNTGGFKLEMAPIAVVLWRNLALRMETYLPVYKNLNGTRLTGSYTLQGGIGITFPSPNPF